MRAFARILLVEDNADARVTMAAILRSAGHEVDTAADGLKALAKMEEFTPDIILTDLRMPGLDGVGLILKAHERDPDMVVVLMTADASTEKAVSAMRQGAADYLLKPIDIEQLLMIVTREFERHQRRTEAKRLRRRLTSPIGLETIMGSAHPAMRQVCETIALVAASRASVLISGESGTGKELIATAIHELSPRHSRPFIKVHCAALAEALLESELFGHERGAFTGANAKRCGRFEQAEGGTIFFDEIGEISPSVQVKLLRVLQTRQFERVGGNQTVTADVRIVAATNRDLAMEVKEGRFREDLFYRLNVVPIATPPLRALRSEILAMAMHFLEHYAKENGKNVIRFTDDALATLVAHPWPGNVRELQNVIERGVLFCRGEQVETADLLIRKSPAETAAPQVPGATMAEIERHALLATLTHVHGSTSRAATMLGLSARTIQYRLRDYMSERPVEAAREKTPSLD
jgi:DNA-binding NtrC family response regulator